MWKFRRPTASMATVLVAATLLAACSTDKSDDRKVWSVKVEAGTADNYKVGDLTVKTSPRSVPRDTELTLTAPKYATPAESLFGINTVKFDLSLDSGRMQPAEPLEVSIPLKGDYLPPGAEAAQALLYTPSQSGKGVELVPATVDGKGVLHAKLYHLSPKILTFPSNAELLALAGLRPAATDEAVTCKESVKIPAGEVKFSSDSQGWSRKKDSPIAACLSDKAGQAQLTITNRVNFLMAVAATDGVKLSASNGADEQVAVKIAQAVFPNKRIKAYVGRDAELQASLPNLPATVELVAEPSAFLSEVAWGALKFLVGIYTATHDQAALAKLANEVLSVPEVMDCLGSSLQFARNPNPSVHDVIDQVTNRCTEEVGKQISRTFGDKNAWDQFWGRMFAVASGGGFAWQTLVATWEGTRMQFVGTLSVKVDINRPKPKVPACPSSEELVSLARGQSDVEAPIRVAPGTELCDSGWFYGRLQWYLPEDFGGWSDSVNAVFKQQSGKWVVHKIGGTDQLDDPECQPMPRKIRDVACG